MRLSSRKRVTFAVALGAMLLAASELRAECILKADYAAFASTRIAIVRPQALVPVTQTIEVGLADTLFGSVVDMQKPKLLTATSVSNVTSMYATRMDELDLFIILDKEMMIGGRPKYDEILAVYRGAQIMETQVVLIDGYPKEEARPSVVLLNGDVDQSLIPWIIEGVALIVLQPSQTLTPKLMDYLSLLTFSPFQPDNPSKAAQTKRQEILAELCL